MVTKKVPLVYYTPEGERRVVGEATIKEDGSVEFIAESEIAKILGLMDEVDVSRFSIKARPAPIEKPSPLQKLDMEAFERDRPHKMLQKPVTIDGILCVCQYNIKCLLHPEGNQHAGK